jgi:site-specific recombinase XerC
MASVQNGHAAALKASKVAPFRIYDLRHTWATRAAEAGMDLPTLAALLGHSKLNMVMRYAHPQERHQAEAMKRLEAFNAAKEIEEIERVQKDHESRVTEAVPTLFPTAGKDQSLETEESITVN